MWAVFLCSFSSRRILVIGSLKNISIKKLLRVGGKNQHSILIKKETTIL
ncbi:hypothetical protein SCAPIOD30019 [Staphylococcus capitis]|nr:hypothetical protein CR01_160019 [Staphylococcus capitis CR01]CQD28135.1 hypothetical protein SCAPIOD200020 [Staphylococcus capitis]CQD28420.1 hypothetical protein SCAPIOD30019 [Staphylococcus capitis]CQD32097.1 hypothetical protein SCAPIOD30019 [Staphylococcus capitis]CRN11776.1 hypothetical protein BN151740019 [Staphylococcus capitis]